MAASQPPTGGLEDRLRGMVLRNTASEGGGDAPGFGSHQQGPVNARSRAQANGQAGRQHRKRPNQAQRRQMSAEMSAELAVPGEPRPFQPAPRPTLSGPATPYTWQQTAPPPQFQKMHSAPFQQGFDSPPGSEPQLSQGHPMSPSAYGPRRGPDQPDWRRRRGPGPGQNAGRNRYPVHDTNPNDVPQRAGDFNPSPFTHGPLYTPRRVEMLEQAALLDTLCANVVANIEIAPSEIAEKEAFRVRIESICQAAIQNYETTENGQQDFPRTSVQLRCFGSLASGFATKAADMDLALLSPLSPSQPDAPGSAIPRLVEKAFLEAGLGARLLSKTRVPIIKLCGRPPDELLRSLLEERSNWENGVSGEVHDDEHAEEEEEAEDPSSSPTAEAQRPGTKEPTRAIKAAEEGPKAPETGKQQKKAALLKQTESQSLERYYSVAKGILHKLGQNDINFGSLAGFSEEDFRALNEFCLAFVHGLADQQLKTRLLSYLSLSEYNLTALPNRRTLLGVHAQMEGERLVMLWHSRELPEKDDVQESQAAGRLRYWTELQNKHTFGQDPLLYTRELQLAVFQLRKIPSLELMQLAQDQYESAGEYHARAIRMMLELGGHDTPFTTNAILPIVIRHYIQGIWKQAIRTQVKEFADNTERPSLRAVARRHKGLQLACEFDRALDKEYYEDDQRADVLEYVLVLRGPMEAPPITSPHFDLVVPVPSERRPLLSRIRDLGNPGKLAANQPRDRYRDRLEFPKTGAGVQCDINFSAHLALHNTLLLRCYSHTDPRVRPLILFVKHWAKARNINTPYRGTLSSYGYVLMALHYLVNVVRPFVCPNLQELARPQDRSRMTPAQIEETVECRGRNVQFWRNEEEILRLAGQNMLNQNRDSIGQLLRGFFEYYAQTNFMTTTPARGFDWGRDVLSLRTHDGLLSKAEKGWTGAKTVIVVQSQGVTASAPDLRSAPPPVAAEHGSPAPKGASEGISSPGAVPSAAQAQAQASIINSPSINNSNNINNQQNPEVKEVRHRYLFAIEDPFELDHNVARTVTHNGIVAIRDEFRRAWRIIRTSTGKGGADCRIEDIMEDVATADAEREKAVFAELLDELHGKGIFDD